MATLKDAGYTAQRLKQQGYTAAELAFGARGRVDVATSPPTVGADDGGYTAKEVCSPLTPLSHLSHTSHRGHLSDIGNGDAPPRPAAISYQCFEPEPDPVPEPEPDPD